MKKTKSLLVILLITVSTLIVYSADNLLSPNGYWIQFDQDRDAGEGIAQSVIHTYFAKNNKHGKKGTLQMEIVVPLMYVNDINEVSTPRHKCYVKDKKTPGSGIINGFKYTCAGSSLKNFVFAGNMKPTKGESKTTSALYDDGGVVNPNDGKAYSSQAQVRDNGKTMFARAWYGSGWSSVGKAASWKRITEADYKQIKADCDRDTKGNYLNRDSKITSQCINYNMDKFGIKSPF